MLVLMLGGNGVVGVMAWCGVAWCGVAWGGVVWGGVAWRGVVRCGGAVLDGRCGAVLFYYGCCGVAVQCHYRWKNK